MHEDMLITLARACHEMNRAYCITLGDYSQKSWDECPDWQQQSAINGVTHYLQTAATPEQMHENWSRVKRNEGWVYGTVKDEEKKTHPCLVPYEELPESQRKKDRIFIQTIELIRS